MMSIMSISAAICSTGGRVSAKWRPLSFHRRLGRPECITRFSKLFSKRLQLEDFFSDKTAAGSSQTCEHKHSTLLNHPVTDAAPDDEIKQRDMTRMVDAGTIHSVQLTKSDEAFREEGIEFVEGCENIDLESLNDLFVKVRFPRRQPLRLRMALDNTYYVLWVRYTKPSSRFAKQGQILGFARVIADGVFFATVWDVAVLPAWQRRGLGRALMERILTKLTRDGISVITLYAEPEVVGLYQKLGFKADPHGVTGMAFPPR